MSEELAKVSSLLDKLTVEALMLMEQHIEAKLSLEHSMSEGESHLVKSRYIMGQRNVCTLQLPTGESPEFTAIAQVTSCEDKKLFGQKIFDLEFKQKPNTVEDSLNYRDPLRWFGVLVPQDLHKAQAKYKQALMQSILSANIQTQLHETCIKIKQLRDYKLSLLKEE